MAEGLEDAIAVALDILFESQLPANDNPLRYINQRAKRLLEILKIMRTGPDAYDPDSKS